MYYYINLINHVLFLMFGSIHTKDYMFRITISIKDNTHRCITIITKIMKSYIMNCLDT